MTSRPVLLVAAALLPTASAGEVEIHGAVTAAPQIITEDRASPYYVGPPTVDTPHRSSRQDIELKLQKGGFNAQGILRQQVAEGHRPEYHGIANQFYFDGELAPGLGWTVGRKVMSWGVGFGFKPLDVVQRENRRSVSPPPLVGVPLVALERFTAADAWTVAWTRPGQGAGERDDRDPGVALHWYRLADGDDLHGVLRVSRRRRLEAGVGATRVVGDEWSIYGAALHQQRSWRRRNTLIDAAGLLAATDPLVDEYHGGGVRSVLGAQWTGASGWSVLAEAWYDADAYRHRDWQDLDALTARQRALEGIAPAMAIGGNVAWSSQAFLATNLLRENVLLRIAYDDRDGFKPYAELLITPRDRGLVTTVGASFEGNRQRVSFGLRQLGGAADSAYARAPIRRLLWAEWRLAMF